MNRIAATRLALPLSAFWAAGAQAHPGPHHQGNLLEGLRHALASPDHVLPLVVLGLALGAAAVSLAAKKLSARRPPAPDRGSSTGSR